MAQSRCISPKQSILMPAVPEAVSGSCARSFDYEVTDRAVSAAALFACHPVEAFAQQIGMAQVPGVLLDQVQVEPAQRVRIPLAEGVVELVSGHDLPGPGAVRAERLQVRGGPGGGDGLEVAFLVLVGAVQPA